MRLRILNILILLILGMSTIGSCSSSSSSATCDGDGSNAQIWGKLDAQWKKDYRIGDILYGDGNPGDKSGHVGIIIKKITDENLIVREAMPGKGVQDIRIQDFLGRCYKRIFILRATENEQIAKKAAQEAMNMKGVYLNSENEVHVFQYPTCAAWCDDSRWYCSKLVFKAYERAGIILCPYERICVTPAGIFNSAKVVAYWEGTWRALAQAPKTISDILGTNHCYYKSTYCGCHCSNTGVPGWNGNWGSSFGNMKLQQQGSTVTGTYKQGFREGWITNCIAYNSGTNTYLSGNWNEKGKSGPFWFKLSDDGKLFWGEWKYGNRLNWAPGKWDGWRN